MRRRPSEGASHHCVLMLPCGSVALFTFFGVRNCTQRGTQAGVSAAEALARRSWKGSGFVADWRWHSICLAPARGFCFISDGAVVKCFFLLLYSSFSLLSFLPLTFFSSSSLCFGPHYLGQAVLELSILLPQPPECSAHRCVVPHGVILGPHAVLEDETIMPGRA